MQQHRILATAMTMTTMAAILPGKEYPKVNHLAKTAKWYPVGIP
jgi:hypothetical protein